MEVMAQVIRTQHSGSVYQATEGESAGSRHAGGENEISSIQF